MKSKRTLSNKTKLYLAATVLVAGATLPHQLDSAVDQAQLLLFAVLTIGATVSQLFPVVTPRNQAYHVTPVFVFAGVLLLNPLALAQLVIIAFTCERLKIKYPWYIQLFNVSNFLIDAAIARGLYLVFGGTETLPLGSLAGVTAAVSAAAAFTAVNHLLLAIVLRLARGHSWRQTGLFDSENFLTDATLACIGIIAALLWEATPLVLILIASPMFLIYRSLNTLNLQEQAHTDDKTGLYNTRRFQQVFAEELRRAQRFGRPLSVIMADMDLLRNINNSYGHLAGDVVLKGVAATIKNGLREFDLAARFGGEEFAILLPETDADQGLAIAERLRSQVEESRFSVATSVRPIEATLSLGVAAFPNHGQTGEEVLHQADMAVYYAKLHGRNRAWACSPESMALGPEMVARAAGSGADRDQATIPESTRIAEQTISPTEGMNRTESADHGRHVECTTIHGECNLTTLPNGEAKQDQEATRRRGRSDDLTPQVRVLIALELFCSFALWLFVRPWEGAVDWTGLAALAALAVAAQGMAIDIYGRGKVSVSAIMVLAGGILWGVPGGLPLALLVALATRIINGGVLHRTLFDIGNLSLAAAAAATSYQLIASNLPGAEIFLLIIPAAIAALTYYALNIGLLSLAMSLGERRSVFGTWEERFRWLLPHYLSYGALALVIALAFRAIGLYGLLVFFVPPLMLRYAMKQYIHRTEENVSELKRVNRQVVNAHDEVVRTLRELRATYDATVTALSVALDSRDSVTEGHSRRVVEYTSLIAQKLEVPDTELPGLLKGALLHDVGKIGIPDAILRKPGPLTVQEWAIMKTHPEQGCRMLAHIGFLKDAVSIVLNHHERCDGTGYPNGLKGDEIPIGARIFAVADGFDAMTSDRPYRPAASIKEAREEIQRCAGKQFDPAVVEAFLSIDVGKLRALGDAKRGGPQPSVLTEPRSQLEVETAA